MEKICRHLEDQEKCSDYEKSTQFNRCMYLRPEYDNHCDFIDKSIISKSISMIKKILFIIIGL